jgi:hypothetical protein
VQLVEFKRKNGHCTVPKRYKQDKSLGMWISTQRSNHVNNKLRPYRKELLDEINFVWKDVTLAARSSTWIISRFGRQVMFLTLILFFFTCVEFEFGSVHQQCGSPKRSSGRNGTITRPCSKPS